MLRNKREFSPRIILLLTVLVTIIVVTVSIIVVNVQISGWQTGEILISLGTAFFVVGSILATVLFAAGSKIPNVNLHIRNSQIAIVDSNYAREQRNKFPWLGTLFLIVGGILLGIGFSLI